MPLSWQPDGFLYTCLFWNGLNPGIRRVKAIIQNKQKIFETSEWYMYCGESKVLFGSMHGAQFHQF